MNAYGVYLVTGTRQYRGHDPGTVFEAVIDGPVAQRAIDRGDIRLLRTEIPDLTPGSYRLPAGWLKQAPQEAPTGASSIEGGGKK